MPHPAERGTGQGADLKADGPDGDSPDSRFGVLWLLSDMVLISAMTVVVKLQGATYPALQLVFIRSLIGLVTL